MESKKINQLATEMSPATTDLTIVGDPITGVSKKITLEQIASLFAGSVSFYANLAAFPVTGTIDTIYCAKDTNKLYLWSGSAYVQTFPSQALLDTYQLRSEKGASNGYASLDSSGKVPVSQLPSSIMEYKGMWSAATNTPTLANGTGDTGDVYICNAAGSVNFGAGVITFAVGDYVIYSGSIWQRSSGAVGTVTSVAVTESGDSLNITGSPITTSGTINIGFNGTNLQYVNGAGNLTTFPILTGYVPYTGATANVDLGVFDLTADLITGATGSFASSGSSDTFAINHSSGAGIALNITKGGNGEGLYINKTSGSGNAATIVGTLNATTLVKSGGTSSQFLKADGTVDSSTYALDSLVVHLAGTETITGAKTFSGYTTFTSTVDITSGLTFSNSGFTLLLQPPTLSVNRTVTLPNGTGTLALTSDLTAYVTLATAQTISGAKTFSGTSLFTGSATFNSALQATIGILFPTSATVSSGAGVVGLGAYSGGLRTAFNGGYTSDLAFQMGASYVYTFPASSGTIALVGGSGVGTVTSVAALTIGTSGTDLSSSVANSTTTPVITLNVPTASATNRGALSSADWTTFNNKASTASLANYLPLTGGTLTGALGFNSGFGTSTAAISIYNNTGASSSNVALIDFRVNNSFGGNERVASISASNPNAAGNNGGQINFLVSAYGTGTIPTTGMYLAQDKSLTLLGALNGTSAVFSTTGAFGNATLNGAYLVVKGANGVPASSGTTTTAVFRVSSGTGLYNVLDFGTNEASDYSWIQSTRANSLGTYDYLAIQPNGGNLLVGTLVNSTYKLDVNGTGRFSGNLRVDGTSNGYLTLNATSTGGNESGIFFQVGGANKWENYTANNDTALNWYSYANSTIVFKLASTGAATFSSSVDAVGRFGATTNQITPTDGSAYFYKSSAGAVVSGFQFIAETGGAGSRGTRLTIDSTGAATFSNKVGVGGAAATYSLTAYNGANGTTAAFGGTARGLRIDNDGTFSSGRTTIFGVDNTFYGSYQPLAISGSELYFSISGVDKFTIASTGAATFSSSIAATSATFSGIITANSAASAANGSINIENTDPTVRFRVTGGTANSRIYEWRAIAAGGVNDVMQLRLWNDAQSSASTLFTIASTGAATFSSSVTAGYGTSSGYATLNLIDSGTGSARYASIRKNYDSPFDLRIRASNSESAAPIVFDLSNAAEAMRITSGGNVLIGTTDDGGRLVSYSTTAATQIKAAGTAPAISFSNTVLSPTIGGSLGACTAANQFITGTASGDMILINQFTGNKLYITNYSGGVYLTQGATSWTANSDIRLKNINSHIENAVEKLSTLQTINFSYKDDKTNKQNLGLIAQEVEKIFPELIDKNGDGMLGVRYTELVPVLIKAIQELKLEIETLKNK